MGRIVHSLERCCYYLVNGTSSIYVYILQLNKPRAELYENVFCIYVIIYQKLWRIY